jgi:hypothetical protein
LAVLIAVYGRKFVRITQHKRHAKLLPRSPKAFKMLNFTIIIIYVLRSIFRCVPVFIFSGLGVCSLAYLVSQRGELLRRTAGKGQHGQHRRPRRRRCALHLCLVSFPRALFVCAPSSAHSLLYFTAT